VLLNIRPVSSLLLATVGAAFVGACASTAGAPPAGLVADKFVTMNCAENKSFQVRWAADGKTLRVRSHAGSAELSRQPDGKYAADGFVLDLAGAGGASLDAAGKSQGKACKAG
jgi:hypothetical protein